MSRPVVARVLVDGNLDGALKDLKKKLTKAGIFGELKRKSFYRKPSEARAFKSHRARHKILKNLARRAESGDYKPSFATNGARRP